MRIRFSRPVDELTIDVIGTGASSDIYATEKVTNMTDARSLSDADLEAIEASINQAIEGFEESLDAASFSPEERAIRAFIVEARHAGIYKDLDDEWLDSNLARIVTATRQPTVGAPVPLSDPAVQLEPDEITSSS